jgi:hypothetical protein
LGFHRHALGREFRAHGGRGDRTHDVVVFDFLAAATCRADEQHAVMGVVTMLARRIGVETLNPVHEAVLEEEIRVSGTLSAEQPVCPPRDICSGIP